MLGTEDHPSAGVAALDRQPPVAPSSTDRPWDYADPATWKPARPLDVVLVAPDGRTAPDGYGPAPLLEGFWADWNPRYARGGSDARYDTPPPRFASYVVDELVPYVERHLGVAGGRGARALAGTSLGGYGSYAIGLTYPDEWASIGAVSGIMNILLAPGVSPSSYTGAPGMQPPVQAGPATIPAPLGGTVPLDALPGPARDIGVVFYAFGDPAVDQAYYRARQPVDLAMNAAARRGDRQSLVIRGFSNDTVARRPADLSLPDYFVAQGFEDLVLPTNLEMNQAFADQGVRQHYELHPGLHADTYWNPWLRDQVEAQYAAMRHPGGGDPPPAPSTFSYGSAAKTFDVWGWQVAVNRPVLEFLRLTDVSCHGFTARGTGRVRVVVPGRCHTGLDGSRVAHVDLGPSMPTDAPAGADAVAAYGRTVRVELTRR
jgi:S-formylglutathione hydrolase FrmB